MPAPTAQNAIAEAEVSAVMRSTADAEFFARSEPEACNANPARSSRAPIPKITSKIADDKAFPLEKMQNVEASKPRKTKSRVTIQ